MILRVESTESDLVRRSRCGDPRAAEELYGLFSAAVHGYALALTRHASQADDLLQEAFLRLFRGDAADAIDQPGPFLHAVVRNLVRDERRRHAVRNREAP